MLKKIQDWLANGPTWGCWLVISLIPLVAYHVLIVVSRDPTWLITIFWGLVNVVVVAFLYAILRPQKP